MDPGDYSETLQLDLRAGAYRAEWVDPATGKVLGAVKLEHAGGSAQLAAPHYRVDIALRIKRV